MRCAGCARSGPSTSSTPTTPSRGDALGETDVPLVVSVHGGDVFFTGPRFGEERIRRVFDRAALVLANSEGIRRMVGTPNARVVHLGTDIPDPEPPHEPDTLVTVGHLVARKRHDLSSPRSTSCPAGAT